jgi:hypothetical protein
VKLFIRLATEINGRLRSMLRYRGDLSVFVEEALVKTDLKEVLLFSRPVGGKVSGTTVSIAMQTAARLKAAAGERGCSVNALANSAFLAWLGPGKRK